MIRVAALTAGEKTPSRRFRVKQHLELLRSEHQIDVDEYVPAIEKGRKVPLLPESIKPKYVPPLYAAWLAILAGTRVRGIIGSRTHQVTWLQRELIAGLYTLERLLKPPIIYDIDDAIWMVSMLAEHTNRSIARRVDVVIAGNTYLADWYSQYAKDVRIVPTAIDTDRFIPPPSPTTEEFIIGWTGSFGNLPYLEMIEPALHRFLSTYQAAKLRVICDKEPNFHLLRDDQVEFIPWSPEMEVTAVQSMNVGLMPLEDTLWTRGKCSFKMLQYMSCQIPVVVSPVGMNNDVLAIDQVGLAAKTQDEWYEAIEHYYLDQAAVVSDGLAGRRVVLSHFSKPLVAKKIAVVFKSLV